MGPWRVNQMQTILDVIGSPDESEIGKFKNEKTRKYLNSLPQSKKNDLKTMFPGGDEYAIDLMTELLKFDADKRISSKDILQHSYFKQYKDDKESKNKRTKKSVIWNAFYFEDEIKEDKYWRSLILNEILKHNQDEFWRFVDSGALKGYPIDVIVYGYIRQYIEINVICIPYDIVNLLCSLFFIA